jgi:hypothetical protein
LTKLVFRLRKAQQFLTVKFHRLQSNLPAAGRVIKVSADMVL